jgi:hypothetical protein
MWWLYIMTSQEDSDLDKWQFLMRIRVASIRDVSRKTTTSESGQFRAIKNMTQP